MSKPVILCVDDEIVVLDSLQVEFQEAFANLYECETAESAEEALDIIEELYADNMTIILIISDWLMPGMKGDEFLILAHQKLPEVSKILLTGQADSDAINNVYKKANACYCLHKPVDSKTLIKTGKLCLNVEHG